jgi:hypothetical protein
MLVDSVKARALRFALPPLVLAVLVALTVPTAANKSSVVLCDRTNVGQCNFVTTQDGGAPAVASNESGSETWTFWPNSFTGHVRVFIMAPGGGIAKVIADWTDCSAQTPISGSTVYTSSCNPVSQAVLGGALIGGEVVSVTSSEIIVTATVNGRAIPVVTPINTQTPTVTPTPTTTPTPTRTPTPVPPTATPTP